MCSRMSVQKKTANVKGMPPDEYTVQQYVNTDLARLARPLLRYVLDSLEPLIHL